MKKCLFEKDEDGFVIDKISEGCEFVSEGKGFAAIMMDGLDVLIWSSVIHKRHDRELNQRGIERKAINKPFKRGHYLASPLMWIPENQNGKNDTWPGWVPVNDKNKDDEIYLNSMTSKVVSDGTYTLFGKDVNNNPHGLEGRFLVKDGNLLYDIEIPSSYSEIKEYLRTTDYFGIMWLGENGKKAVISKTDFGLPWNE